MQAIEQAQVRPERGCQACGPCLSGGQANMAQEQKAFLDGLEKALGLMGGK